MVVLSCAVVLALTILLAAAFTTSMLLGLAASSAAGLARRAARELAATVARPGRPATRGLRPVLAAARLIQTALGALRS